MFLFPLPILHNLIRISCTSLEDLNYCETLPFEAECGKTCFESCICLLPIMYILREGSTELCVKMYSKWKIVNCITHMFYIHYTMYMQIYTYSHTNKTTYAYTYGYMDIQVLSGKSPAIVNVTKWLAWHQCTLAAKESGLEYTWVNNDDFTVLVSGAIDAVEWACVLGGHHIQDDWVQQKSTSNFLLNLNITLPKLFRWFRTLSGMMQWMQHKYKCGTNTSKTVENLLKVIHILEGLK